MARPRHQNGWLTEHGNQLYGNYWRYVVDPVTSERKKKHASVALGMIDELKRWKAKEKLRGIIAEELGPQALTTPLSYTASPEELDAELGKHLASYVDSHIQLGNTLAEAKAEMDAAAKAARQRAKASQQTSKPAQPQTKPELPVTVASTAETPNLFASQPASAEQTSQAVGPGGGT